MYNKLLLASILGITTYWFWISPEFKEVAAWVAIFLFWMQFLQQWFRNFTWWKFEQILQKSTDKTYKSMIFWFIASTLMQSSSLVWIITISFLSAELITLIQWIWILLWANIWTTTWAWLIAWLWMKINISAYAMPLLVFWITLVFQKNKISKWIWYVLAWIWFVFLWIYYMKVWFETFQNSFNFKEYSIEWFNWVLIFVLIWLLTTIIVQSSHATIMLVITALAVWQISYENSLAIVIWANIWTNVTSFLISLTWNKDSKRLWLIDLIFKILAWLIFTIFIFQIIDIVDILANILWINENSFTLKLAIFHTLFNIVGVIILLPIMNYIINLVKKVFPDEKLNIYWNYYLNKDIVNLPDTAIISLIKETRHLYNNSIEVILEYLWLKNEDILWEIDIKELKKKIKINITPEEIESLYNKKIKILYGEIIDFAINAQNNNGDKYTKDINKIKVASRNIAEITKKVWDLQKNLQKYLKSQNLEIKYQYEKIITDLINIIIDINKLKNIKKKDEKLEIYIWIQKSIEEWDVINNWNLNSLIREEKISNEMATSLINDSNCKKEVFKKLVNISEIIYNNEISDDITVLKNKKTKDWLEWSDFWLTWKKLSKTISKLKKKEKKLQKKLIKETIQEKIEKIKEKINNINFIITKYKKDKI